MATGTDKKSKMLVAGIDFGTTYSGYAFSFKTDYNDDPMKMQINQTWRAGSMALSSYKAPTCVLFDENKKFHSFGYEAEDNYSELVLDGEHKTWYFFKRFKMRLHCQKLSRDIQIDDDFGRKFPAIEVFGESIKFLKTHLLKCVKRQGILNIKEGDIHWVLTVPAIWTDSAKQFMREAANEAGIDGANLTIALEPEAASLFCKLLPTEKTSNSFKASRAGSKYMVIDLGGGTADITVHQIQATGELTELHKATGGAWGGTKVDEEFNQLLIKIVGGPVFHKFRTEFCGDFLDLQRELEMRKRTVTPESKGKITLKVPVKLAELYEEEFGEKVQEAIAGSQYAGKLIWLPDKIRVDASIFKGLFKACSDKIVDHVKNLLQMSDISGTTNLLMVGGFSDSEMIQTAITDAFPDSSVIIPEDACLCVLKGAVIFGHSPVTIASRVSKYTYGVNISPVFDADEHTPERRVVIGGVERCRDVFKRYIQEGESIKMGEARSGKHVTLSAHQTEMILTIYASTKRTPKYVDEEGTDPLGKMIVKLPDTDGKITVEVRMMFGATELSVEAEELSTNNIFTAYFDFL